MRKLTHKLWRQVWGEDHNKISARTFEGGTLPRSALRDDIHVWASNVISHCAYSCQPSWYKSTLCSLRSFLSKTHCASHTYSLSSTLGYEHWIPQSLPEDSVFTCGLKPSLHKAQRWIPMGWLGVDISGLPPEGILKATSPFPRGGLITGIQLKCTALSLSRMSAFPGESTAPHSATSLICPEGYELPMVGYA